VTCLSASLLTVKLGELANHGGNAKTGSTRGCPEPTAKEVPAAGCEITREQGHSSTEMLAGTETLAG